MFLGANFAIAGLALLAFILLSIPCFDYPIAMGHVSMPPTAFLAVFLELAILLLHIVTTCWLRAWWPFRKVFLWYGLGGGVLLFCFVCTVLPGILFQRHVSAHSASGIGFYCMCFWVGLACALTAFLWAHRTFLDPSVKTPEEAKNAQLQEKCDWARKYVRDAFGKCADLISAHYSEADLEFDLDQYFGSGSTHRDACSIHVEAKDLVARIDSRRAYETVRLAHAKELEQRGGTVPWSEIEDDAERLLAELPLSEIRERESKLLTRIRQLSEWHRNGSQATERKAECVRTEEDIEAAIADEVRRDAHPDDTEDDIEREIDHRLRGFRERCAA
jgi:hypothetical protein